MVFPRDVLTKKEVGHPGKVPWTDGQMTAEELGERFQTLQWNMESHITARGVELLRLWTIRTLVLILGLL